MTEPNDGGSPEIPAQSPEEHQAAVWIGRASCYNFVEKEIPAISSPDGFVGLSVGHVLPIIVDLEPDDKIWFRPQALPTPAATEEKGEGQAADENRQVVAGGRLVIDRDRMEIEIDGEVVDFTPTEYSVLDLLMSNSGRVLSKQEILDHYWGNSDPPYSNAINVKISRIRKKLGTELADIIVTKPRVGYMFNDRATP